jgi:energy-converting hydrogenase Eha subunit H
MRRFDGKTRRRFLKTAGLGALGLFGTAPSVLSALEPMRVDRVDIVTFSEDLDIGGQSGGAGLSPYFCVKVLAT